MVSAPSTHIHISEREPDGTFEDCTWDAGLEFYRDAFDPTMPATHAESQRLRAASGEPPTGGSNLGDFRRGVKARYSHSLPAAIPAKGILTALKPGYVAVVQGSMSAFGPTNPLSKWDRNFDGGHAVWLGRHPDGTLLWCDPEAPTAAAVPIAITASDVQKFVNAFPGEAIVAPAKAWAPKPPKEEPVEPITQYLPGYTAIINAESNVRAAPHIAATKFRTTVTSESITLIGTVKGDVDPGNGKDVWYMWWKNGRYEFTALDNVRDVKAPAGGVDDGYTKATQDAAVAAQKAADNAALNAAVAKAATEAAAAEKERIAKVVGESSAEAIRSV